MPPQRRPAQRPQQIAQRLIAEEVHALVGHFEPRFCLRIALIAFTGCGRLFGVQKILVLHALDDLVDQLFYLVRLQRVELLLRIFVENFTRFERLLDRLAQALHRVVHVLERRIRILKSGVQQKIRQRLHQVIEPEA